MSWTRGSRGKPLRDADLLRVKFCRACTHLADGCHHEGERITVAAIGGPDTSQVFQCEVGEGARWIRDYLCIVSPAIDKAMATGRVKWLEVFEGDKMYAGPFMPALAHSEEWDDGRMAWTAIYPHALAEFDYGPFSDNQPDRVGWWKVRTTKDDDPCPCTSGACYERVDPKVERVLALRAASGRVASHSHERNPQV